ncbi:hypothetical protein MYAM1_003563 [Malassezia yamatoensis]|uniref:Uncharacterized protein n=1 Tax=Malassezia yamatoensis TaxID=253288 RepID=A0AAJ6CJ06_9BASI|nr:hypothetical protein MYAM1_003563 [Malassezia yamatoensis]
MSMLLAGRRGGREASVCGYRCALYSGRKRFLQTVHGRDVLLSAAQLYSKDSAWHSWLMAQANAERRTKRVVIAGPSTSGTRQLVDALLSEPHDHSVTRAILAKDSTMAKLPEGLLIQCGEERPLSRNLTDFPPISEEKQPRQEPLYTSRNTVQMPLPWLQQGVELVELLDPQQHPLTYQALYSADALFFVLDLEAIADSSTYELHHTLALLRYFAAKPNTAIVVNLPWRAVHTTTPAPASSALSRAIDMPDYNVILRTLQKTIGSRVLKLLSEQSSLKGNVGPGVYVVSSDLAAHAKSMLDPSMDHSRDAWLEFSHRFREAQFPLLYDAIIQPCDPQDHVTYLTQTAIHTASAAEALEADRIRTAEGYASVLETEAKHALNTLTSRILSKNEPAHDENPTPSAEEVRRADASSSIPGYLADSRHQVETTLRERFPWYKLPMRIDELRLTLLYMVGQSFGSEQETRLAYEAGRLREEAQSQYQQTVDVLQELTQYEPKVVNAEEKQEVGNSPAPMQDPSKETVGNDTITFQALTDGTLASAQPPFNSATLRNALTTFGDAHLAPVLTPKCLSEPLQVRRSELLGPQGPITQLTARAQRAVLHSYLFLGSVYFGCIYGTLNDQRIMPRAKPLQPIEQVSSVAELSATEWTPWTMPEWVTSLVNSSEHLVLAPHTASATALFATALTAWYLQGRWTAAKRKFWRDWDRVVSVVDREEKQEVESVIRSALGAPMYAADQLRQVSTLRQAAHEHRLAQLRNLQQTTHSEQ